MRFFVLMSFLIISMGPVIAADSKGGGKSGGTKECEITAKWYGDEYTKTFTGKTEKQCIDLTVKDKYYIRIKPLDRLRAKI